MHKQAVTASVTGIGRVQELQLILDHISHNRCVSLVGVSNIGKSRVLRACERSHLLEAYFGRDTDTPLVLYVDFNRMLQHSEQGFYELLLRCLTNHLRQTSAEPELLAILERSYSDVVQPPSPFSVPLAFNRAISALIEALPRNLVLLFDEFDDPLRILEGRVFLNLRALIDQYSSRIAYVMATGQRPENCREKTTIGLDEYLELFAAHVYHLGPLCYEDTLNVLTEFATHEETRLPRNAQELLAHESGGHPGLLVTGIYCLAKVHHAAPRGNPLHSDELRDELDRNPSIRRECSKLWNELSTAECRAAEDLIRLGTSRLTQGIQLLTRKGLVRDDGQGLSVFSDIWARYIMTQYQARKPTSAGVRMDVETGEVWIDGTLIPYLTPLENRLLMMLYGHLGQVCTKEEIVEAVYAHDYTPNDNAALQRLVRRLREKIEQDPPIRSISPVFAATDTSCASHRGRFEWLDWAICGMLVSQKCA